MKKFHGTGVALVTPFNRKGEIDFEALGKLLDHTAQGIDYYVLMGTTGESVTVSPEEKVEVTDFVRKNNRKKLPIIFGIGGNNTNQIIKTIHKTDLTGIDGILSVCPYYNKPSQEGIYRHFMAIADASPVPVILYNVPGRTSSNMEAGTTLRLADHPRIVGIKEASGNFSQCIQIAKRKPKNFLLISGDDLLTLPLLSIGAAGVISVLANAFPVLFAKMVSAFINGETKGASVQLYKMIDINAAMYEEGSPVGVKQLLSELGICKNYCRLPMTEASPELQKKIRDLLTTIR